MLHFDQNIKTHLLRTTVESSSSPSSPLLYFPCSCNTVWFPPCSTAFTHRFCLFCPSMQMASPQSLICFECGLMSAWHRRWCQLDNDKIASDLSGIAFIVVIRVIYCSDVPRLCHDLLGTLPFTLIGLATHCDRSHRWQTWSEALETAATISSHLDPIYSEALSFSCKQITCT